MKGAIRFIRKAGRIIPIRVPENVLTDVGAAVGVGMAAGYAATAARQRTMEAIRGKGKKGTGNRFATALVDFTGATALTMAAAHRSARVARGFERLGFMLRRR